MNSNIFLTFLIGITIVGTLKALKDKCLFQLDKSIFSLIKSEWFKVKSSKDIKWKNNSPFHGEKFLGSSNMFNFIGNVYSFIDFSTTAVYMLMLVITLSCCPRVTIESTKLNILILVFANFMIYYWIVYNFFYKFIFDLSTYKKPLNVYRIRRKNSYLEVSEN